jgi:hypothetical protein
MYILTGLALCSNEQVFISLFLEFSACTLPPLESKRFADERDCRLSLRSNKILAELNEASVQPHPISWASRVSLAGKINGRCY